MIRTVLLFLTCAWLCPPCIIAQELVSTSAETFSAVKVTFASAPFAAGATAAGPVNAGVADQIAPSGLLSKLTPATLPPLEPEYRFGEERSLHPTYEPGLTFGWRHKPVNREQDEFQWANYLKSNVHMLSWQHAYRILFQEKTRVGLRQPILKQWGADIRAIPQSWGDGDSFMTNGVGHPLMGSVMGYLEVINHPVHSRLNIDDAGYWQARSMAFVASTAASLQFEIGPLSEASLGLNPTKQGLTDFIITPVVGTGFLVAEDALDKYVIARLEAGRRDMTKRFLRCTLNPARTLANLFAFRAAWARDTRP